MEQSKLPEAYKFQSSYSQQKIKAEAHQDSGNLALNLLSTKLFPSLKRGPRKSF
jgi:hypothetical protein